MQQERLLACAHHHFVRTGSRRRDAFSIALSVLVHTLVLLAIALIPLLPNGTPREGDVTADVIVEEAPAAAAPIASPLPQRPASPPPAAKVPPVPHRPPHHAPKRIAQAASHHELSVNRPHASPQPTTRPHVKPVPAVSAAPTVEPSTAPTVVAVASEPPTAAPVPTPAVTAPPTIAPTIPPTTAPTARPTIAPPASAPPTVAPTARPTVAPTLAPTTAPTARPTVAPTARPTEAPSLAPTAAPTARPTVAPTARPTTAATTAPTTAPSARPTTAPTAVAVARPTAAATSAATSAPGAAARPAPTAAAGGATGTAPGRRAGPPANAPSKPQAHPPSAPALGAAPPGSPAPAASPGNGLANLNDRMKAFLNGLSGSGPTMKHYNGDASDAGKSAVDAYEARLAPPAEILAKTFGIVRTSRTAFRAGSVEYLFERKRVLGVELCRAYVVTESPQATPPPMLGGGRGIGVTPGAPNGAATYAGRPRDIEPTIDYEDVPCSPRGLESIVPSAQTTPVPRGH